MKYKIALLLTPAIVIFVLLVTWFISGVPPEEYAETPPAESVEVLDVTPEQPLASEEQGAMNPPSEREPSPAATVPEPARQVEAPAVQATQKDPTPTTPTTGTTINDDKQIATTPYSAVVRSETATLTWGPFIKSTVQGGSWDVMLRAENRSDDLMLVLFDRQYDGRTSTDAFVLDGTTGKYASLGATVSDESPINITVHSGIGNDPPQPDFGIYTITVKIYACSKIAAEDYAQLCEMTAISQKSPFDTLEERSEAGDPIEPTDVVVKKYNVSSLDMQPTEISN